MILIGENILLKGFVHSYFFFIACLRCHHLRYCLTDVCLVSGGWGGGVDGASTLSHLGKLEDPSTDFRVSSGGGGQGPELKLRVSLIELHRVNWS